MIGRGSMERTTGTSKAGGGTRLIAALAAVSLLSGCGIFKGGSGKPKTAVLGERIPVLMVESSSTTDASLTGLAVAVTPAEPNDAWPQPGGNAQKAMGNVALGPQPQRIWTAKISGNKGGARLAAGPVVADGRLYVTDALAQVRAIDIRTGRTLWIQQLKGEGGPALRDTGVKGLVGMKAGGSRELVIPAALGYGATGSGSTIKPNETLIFLVDMVKV